MRDHLQIDNPFDVPRSSIPDTEVVVGPVALSASTDQELIGIGMLNEYRHCTVYGVALDDTARSRLIDARIIPLYLSARNDTPALYNDILACVIGALWKYPQLRRRGYSREEVVEEWLANDTHFFDICALGPRARTPQVLRKERWRVTDLVGVKTRLRVLMSSRGAFEQAPQCFVDKGLYLGIRRSMEFRTYRPAWIRAYVAKTPEGIEEQFSSLGSRLEFLCQAQDYVLESVFRTPGKVDPADSLYHLSSLCLTAAGILDDLARILDVFFPGNRSREAISLRTDRRGRSRLLDEVATSAPELAAVLRTGRLRSGIDAVNLLRDQLQHRDLPLVVRSSQSKVAASIVIPRRTVQLIVDSAGPPEIPYDNLPGEMSTSMVDAYWMEEFVFSTIAEVVKEVLDRLPWDPIVTNLPEAEQGRIQSYLDEYANNPLGRHGFWANYVF